EAVADRNRLRDGLRGEIDDVKGSRREIARGGDGRLGPVGADRDAKRPVVDLDVRAGWLNRLTVRQQDDTVRLDPNRVHGNERDKPDGQESAGKRERGDSADVCHDERM